MNIDSQLAQAKEKGYIFGTDHLIEKLQNPFYEWCRSNQKPYIAITKRKATCHFSVDTPSTKIMLNKSSIKALMEKYIETEGMYSIGCESMYHDNVPIHNAEQLAMGIIAIFQDQSNLEI